LIIGAVEKVFKNIDVPVIFDEISNFDVSNADQMFIF